jgi:hypothetical protein
LTEEELDYGNARLERSPRKSQALLFQLTDVWSPERELLLDYPNVALIKLSKCIHWNRETQLWIYSFAAGLSNQWMKVHLTHSYCVLLAKRAGRVNTPNNQYRSSENTSVLVEAPLHDPKVGLCVETVQGE